ncbi:ATG16 family protein [Aspergillus glaucus CBS 516.65]|uniref:Autophagy-related protein 16 domain-containing protein n=1 Tax=Aspergillus glaucus CBS 516.65 TaxID=1160497 RepID=A0A1L9VBS6_ASPGL|nr:hypothetical protein ASPGLDRAFT_28194 [Aspergillus glaucus CBS 516.65]OJJ81364.1 hypothetical protein ASPGLDRAFT_28194 [Aspergillus glaucus CBS 516.65]
MAHWREEYSAALTARDRREKANVGLYNAYTQLADRTAKAVPTSADAQQHTRATSPAGKPAGHLPGHPDSSLQDALAATRTDLTEAQRSRAELQDRLARISADLEKLRKRSAQDGKRINALEGERTYLQLRLKDRDEELRGKAKLLDDFQDELATLNLQLNMAEEQSNRLQRENQELVDRWMARMGKEAEAMNDASRYS